MEQGTFYYKVWAKGFADAGTIKATSEKEALSMYENSYRAVKILTPNQRKELRTNGEENQE